MRQNVERNKKHEAMGPTHHFRNSWGASGFITSRARVRCLVMSRGRNQPPLGRNQPPPGRRLPSRNLRGSDPRPAPICPEHPDYWTKTSGARLVPPQIWSIASQNLAHVPVEKIHRGNPAYSKVKGFPADLPKHEKSGASICRKRGRNAP